MDATGSIPRTAAGLGLLAALLWAPACATPMTEADVERKLRSAGATVHTLGPDLLVVPVHADSQVAAWTLIAEARGEGASLLGEQLSHDLRRGARRRAAVVVGGPYPDLTRLVLLDALHVLEDRSLAGLTIVYVGDSRYASELRHAAGTRSARFYHRNLP